MDTFEKAFYTNEKTKEDQFRSAAAMTQTPHLPSTMAEAEALKADRDAKRAYEQRQKDAEQYAADLKQWKIVQQGIREAQFSVDAAQTVFDNCTRSLKHSQARAQKMLDDGFVLRPEPIVELPKAVTPAKPAPVVEEEKIPTRIEIDCPNGCGSKILKGIAYHGLGDVGLLCILDEVRARKSGVSAERIAYNLERQRIAKENSEQATSAAVERSI